MRDDSPQSAEPPDCRIEQFAPPSPSVHQSGSASRLEAQAGPRSPSPASSDPLLRDGWITRGGTRGALGRSSDLFALLRPRFGVRTETIAATPNTWRVAGISKGAAQIPPP